jgi:hypothetical protein
MHIIEHLLNKSDAENESTFPVSVIIFLRFSFDFIEEDENYGSKSTFFNRLRSFPTIGMIVLGYGSKKFFVDLNFARKLLG